MYRTIEEDLFFIQEITIKKKFTNHEMQLHHFFHSLTKTYPTNVIVIEPFIFFFVDISDFFKAKLFINALRKKLNKKILIIREEKTLLNLIFELFPDIYIHDIKYDNDRTISVCFISWEERGIAIGCNGDYIKSINEFFKHFVRFSENIERLCIKCELVEI